MEPAAVAPSIPTTEALAGTAPADAVVARDAGSSIAEALPVTYFRYNDNSLSDKDTVDIFKFYARAGESLGIVLEPKDPKMQIAIDLLGESGEVLTQTQASAPGSSLSFQTSPINTNAVVYIQVRDMNLLVQGVPTPEVRGYALELKPISAQTPSTVQPASIAPPIQVPSATSAPALLPEVPPTEEAKLKPKDRIKKKMGMLHEEASSFLDDPMIFYGLVGLSVLVILLLLLIVVRKVSRKGGSKEIDQQETLVVPPQKENKNAE